MDESIAVVGWACRLPGAPSPQAYWELLRDGVDAVTEAPPDRTGWGAARHGGFLDRVDEFDAAFFGISPREAVTMDPQQRLMLELGWEALEEAGIVPATLRSTATGVFVGVMADDYARLSLRSGAPPLDAHSATGLHRTLIANRLSYLFGLHGPSMTVDTGQSSSLVAVHLACESLRAGESSAALVGGVSLMLAEESAAVTATLGALSPDGRCRVFDAGASGFVRGEGAGLLVLKPLERALADGDRVHCVIRGSATNHDGASEGLTVPSPRAQEAVLRQAYARAATSPAEVGYVELHGTGTKVGDPVEAAALGAVFGRGGGSRPPLAVGSAKTNLGHLEGAAGIAGLLKAALSVEHREIVPSLHFEHPNPRIPLDELGLRVPGKSEPWPDGPAVAGVSSFGMGGANCHVVLAGTPSEPTGRAATPLCGPSGADRAPLLAWPLSARGPQALRGQAERLRGTVLRQPGATLADVGFSLATTRSAFEHRAVLLARDAAGFSGGVTALVDGTPAPGVVQGVAGAVGKTVFVFPGQGSQWPDMAVDLLAGAPVFAAELRRCDEALAAHVDWSLTDVLTGAEGAPPLDRVDVLQPALFAVMVSLTALWRSVGVRPDAVAGHSQGEIAAACAAGALTLDDAARAVALRSRALLRLAGTGAMASVPLPVAECLERMSRWGDRLDVAAVNGPAATVVSGEPRAVAELVAACEASGVRARTIAVDYASHSAAVDAIHDELMEALSGIRPRTGELPFYSTVTGGLLDTATLDAAYWCRNLRHTVRFEQAVEAATADGHRVFVEVSPHPVLTVPLQETFAAADDPRQGGACFAVGSLRRDEPGRERFLTSLAELYVRGVEVDWPAVLAGSGARRVALPTYAFQRRRYFLDVPASTGPTGSALPGSVTPDPPRSPAEHVESADPVEPAQQAGPALAERLAGLPGAERYPAALDVVLAHAAVVAGHGDPTGIEPGLTFKDLGFGSVTAAELATRLAAATGLRLSSTVAFDHPTPADLADHLREMLLGGQEADRPSSAAVPPRVPERPEEDPIAVVAMACRYPGGVTSPEELWRLVERETDAVGDFPTDRGWDLAGIYDPRPGLPGRSYVREGGFVDSATGFDAAFFGISPREALAMDPQQRVLLELAWEAFERAGVDSAALRGSDTAVYAGVSGQDYGSLLTAGGAEGHLLTGGAASVVSGRISYTFGLEGPAMTVDTACSASLVAMHLACQALRHGECSLALAGGVTVMATPAMYQEFSQQKGLADDARCKPFAAAANGTNWAEGAGLVLLERLSDARRAGHPVLAVIRGSAVNQDGASNGLSAPNGTSQQRVLRQALANARLRPDEVDAVEAHGTGTALGDPIEAQALLAVYGRDRPAGRPLALGSLKSNIGHTQAAAGVAGVIKMVMSLGRGLLPRTLHVDAPTPHVDWSGAAVSLLTEARPWPDAGRPRRAGVSAFGISGTNAHLILEQYEEPEVSERGERAAEPGGGDASWAPGGPLPWVLSARGEAALRARADRVAAHLAAAPEVAAEDVAATLAATGTAFRRRAVVLGADRDQLVAGVRCLASGEADPRVIEGVAGAAGPTALVFSGEESVRPGMGRELYAAFPVFARALDHACAWLEESLDRPVRQALLAGPPVTPSSGSGSAEYDWVGRPEYAGPALFATQVALARLVASLGLDHDYVMGCRAGEIAAAHVAGAFSLEDACRLAVARGRLWRGSTVPEAMAGTAAEEFRGVVGRLRHAPMTVPLLSGATGESVDDASIREAGHWLTRAACPPRIEEGVRRLRARGVTGFVELGPAADLTPAIRGVLAEPEHSAGAPRAVAALRHDDASPERLLTSLAEFYVRGGSLDWRRVTDGFPGRRIALPTYPFQRRRFWPTPAS